MSVKRGARLVLLSLLGVGVATCGPADPGGDVGAASDAERPGDDSSNPSLLPCASSIDCEPGRRCIDTRCLQTCTEGEICPDGEPCRSGLCGLSEDCDGLSCPRTGLCRPGSRWCGDQGPMVCASTGIPLPAQPCEPGFSCFEGECVPVACDADNPAVCDGDNIVVCNSPDDRIEAVIACGQDAYQCYGGACVPRLCQPGQTRCSSQAVWQCTIDGQSWRQIEECGPLEICEVDQCRPASACLPGEQRCNGEVVVVCNDSRVGYRVLEQCDGYCEDGFCRDAVCEASTRWCEGNTAFACDARGRTLGSHECGPDAVCTSGSCMPRLCPPGETHCDTRLRLRCNKDGTGWLNEPCANGTICLAGTCLPEGTQFDDGASCDFDEDCLGGECLSGAAFPHGYCSTQACQSDGDCLGGGVCFDDGATAYCAEPCATDASCRPGYGCFDDETTSVCRSLVDPGPFGADFPFQTDCDSRLLQASYFPDGAGLRQFSIMTNSGQSGLFVGLYHLTERPIQPWNLIGPDNLAHGLGYLNPIYGANTELIDGATGLLLPATPAHDDFVHPGETHRLTLSSPDDLVCAYVIPTRPEGLRIDVNLIGVGVDGVAEGLVEGSPLAEMVAELLDIFSDNGFLVDTVRLQVASPEVTESHQIVRSYHELHELFATSEAPGPTIDDRLSINVFLVRDVGFSNGSVVGASGGMPGLAGLHGFASTGLAVSTANLETDPTAVGQVMAHEIGHFLGLAHTTEVTGASIEPIEDTPTCGYLITLAEEFCADASNLMFPYARRSARQLSPDQRWVLLMSPLTKR